VFYRKDARPCLTAPRHRASAVKLFFARQPSPINGIFNPQTQSMKRIALLILISLSAMTQPASAQSIKPHINHLAIYVVNLQRSVAFYTGVFGLDSIPEPFHDNKHAWYRIGPGMALHVIEGATQPKEYFQNNHICFSVASVDAFVPVLKAKNIPWVNAKGEKMQITNRVDGVKQLWVMDPDGYWIEVNDAKE
jgi:lactoylglutathione lyase